MASEIVERMARRLCRASGADPDALRSWMGEEGIPWWKTYETSAQEFLILMQAWTDEQKRTIAEIDVPSLSYQKALLQEAIGKPREEPWHDEQERGTQEGE